jgi:hypothetical protein
MQSFAPAGQRGQEPIVRSGFVDLDDLSELLEQLLPFLSLAIFIA